MYATCDTKYLISWTKIILQELAANGFEKNDVSFENRGTIIAFPNGPF
jgi:hypothetical protein